MNKKTNGLKCPVCGSNKVKIKTITVVPHVWKHCICGMCLSDWVFIPVPWKKS